MQLDTCLGCNLRLDAATEHVLRCSLRLEAAAGDMSRCSFEAGCYRHVLRCSLRLDAGVMLQFVSASDCISVVGAAAGEARRRGPRPLAALESNSFIFFTFFIVWSSFFRQ